MAWNDTELLDAAILDLVSRGAVKVPPYPAVAMKIQQLVSRRDFGLDEIGRLVASDQSLAADALRCANSAFYLRSNPVTTLSQAISLIGAAEVARLAMASGLGAQSAAAGPLAPLRRRVWLEALAVAGLCQELAKVRGLPSEEAFVCGLLHDFGKVIAAGCIEEILAAAPAEEAKPLPLDHWLGLVERYHVELGGVLAARWELPPVVADVLARHHHADASGATDPRLVELVQAADQIVRLLDERTFLQDDDLAAVPFLAPADRPLVTSVLARLPGFIASFEGAATALPAAGSLVVARPPLAGDVLGPVPLDCAARVVVHRQELAYRATGIGERHLILRGAAALPEDLLLSVELRGDVALRCWAVAKLSWPDGGGHRVLLQPFALDEDGQRSWRALRESRLERCGPLADPVWAMAQEIAVDADPDAAAAPVPAAGPPARGVLSRLWSSLTSGTRRSPPRTENPPT